MTNWKNADQAPKDGTRIIGLFFEGEDNEMHVVRFVDGGETGPKGLFCWARDDSKDGEFAEQTLFQWAEIPE